MNQGRQARGEYTRDFASHARQALYLGAAALAIATPGLCAAQTGSAQAQQAGDAAGRGDGIQEIVVTAQRREESLQKVPVAVTALNAATLEARGITSLDSLTTSVTPGLVAQRFAGSSTLAFNMRGVAGSDPGTGLTEQGVAVYIDGVPIGRASGSAFELGDIERIEVLRGPQGTLFGRNAEGGAIQYVTKRPTGEFHAKLEGSYGNYDAYRLLGQIEGPITDTLSVKVGGLLDKHDGYIKNGRPGPADTVDRNQLNDYGESDSKGFRVAARWKPSDAFEANYAFDYTDLEFTPTATIRLDTRVPSELAFCSVPTFAAYCATPQSIAANVFTGTQQPMDPDLKRYPVAAYVPLSKDRIRGHNLTLEYRASDNLTLKSITGYRTLKENLGGNLGTSLVFIQFVPSSLFDGNALNGEVPAGTTVGITGASPVTDIKQSQFSQELQAIGEFGRFQFTGGLFYFHEKVTDIRDSLYTLPYIATGGAQPMIVSINPISISPSRVGYDAKADSYAAYAQGTWTPGGFDDRLKLTVGLRYTNDSKKFVRSISDFNPAALGARSRFKNDRVDPAFVIAYQVNDDINVYGKYSSAYRAGGTQIRNKLALTSYGPEVNKSFEVGFKSSLLDNHVRWNMAGFYSTVSGKQTAYQNLNTDPSSTDWYNLAEKIHIKGVESELTIAPTRGLSLGANYTYISIDQPSSAVDVNGISRPFGVSGTPKHSVSLTADYSFPVFGEAEIALHGDYNYLSQYQSSAAYDLPILPRYAGLEVVNARIALRNLSLGGTRAELAVFARNLFDHRDYAYAFAAGTSDFTLNPIGGAANLTDPRTYGVSLKFEM